MRGEARTHRPGARTLPTDLLRRSLIAALLYLSVAAAVMAAAFILDGMDPPEDHVAELGEDGPAPTGLISVAPWAATR